MRMCSQLLSYPRPFPGLNRIYPPSFVRDIDQKPGHIAIKLHREARRKKKWIELMHCPASWQVVQLCATYPDRFLSLQALRATHTHIYIYTCI